jgi:PDZ domain-containing secreted protein
MYASEKYVRLEVRLLKSEIAALAGQYREDIQHLHAMIMKLSAENAELEAYVSANIDKDDNEESD